MKIKNKTAPDAANVGAMVGQTDKQVNELNIQVCVITATNPQVIGKVKKLDSTGNMIPQKPINIIAGYAENVTFNSMTEFAELLHNAKQNQVLTASTHTAKSDKVKLMTKDAWQQAGKPDDVVTRSKEHLIHKQGVGGLLIVDCDDMSTSKAQLLAAIGEVLPLADLAHVYTTSSSSFIYNKDTGQELDGLKGQRVYIAVTDQGDIERAGNVLIKHLWLAGHGHIEISKSGEMLERTLADKSLFGATHLDYIAGSICHDPLEQRRPYPKVNEGQALDTANALPNLTDADEVQLKAEKTKARELMRGDALLKRDQYTDDRARANLAKQGINTPTSEQMQAAKGNVQRAVEGKLLTGEQIIFLANGEQVTVGEILLNPATYHGQLTYDPIEPDYNGGSIVGRIHLYNGRPNIYSFAHGGRTFAMIPQPRRIEHSTGGNAETTRNTIELMRGLPDYYDLGDQLVKVGDGDVIPLDGDLLSFELGMIAQYIRQTAKGDIPIDPPEKVVRQILAHRRGRNLKSLNAVITAPTITHDDHIVQRRGHDAKTGLYLSMLDDYPPIKTELSKDDAIAAYHELMMPFDTFSFATDLDRAVCLSAILTAVIRPTLTDSVGFAFDAPKQGSGKTYLCECLGILATGKRPAISPPIQNNEDEIRKTVLSMLMQGTRFIVWDNIMGHFDSGVLASLFTGGSFSARQLGKSEQLVIPNRALFTMTGNNLSLGSELGRRVLTCRLDTGEENPSKVKRDLSEMGGLLPDAYIKQNRPALVSAALTIISAYLNSGDGLFDDVAPDKTISYEEWDTLARQPVVWLAQSVEGLADPKQVLDDNMTNDPEHETLAAVLTNIFEWKNSAPFTARELLKQAAFEMCTNPDFGDAIAALCGSKGDPTSIGLGRALSYRRDRIADGLKLVIARKSSKGTTFKVEYVDL
jgi:hypothetical protein